MSEEEKKILNEPSDFENQIAILEDEKKANYKKRNAIYYILLLLLFIIFIVVISYATVYVYKEYARGTIDSETNCKRVNLKTKNSQFPNVNVTDGDNCKPKYNIDYGNDEIAYFNIDVYGDGTFIFNKINQMDETNTYCVMNCDADNDGWPDYNLDLDGDGIADINIVINPRVDNKCDLNCDINGDAIRDINIDLDGDKKPDVNITSGKDSNKPIKNIDYMGNEKPTFNTGDGKENPVNDATKNNKCKLNCDIDGDGWPDYNISLPGNSGLINERISVDESKKVPYDEGKNIDISCKINHDEKLCKYPKVNPGVYINIDTNGDGIGDVNVSHDGGATITNPINKPGTINGKPAILNEDTDGDGFPDINIDYNNDGIPDLNITDKDNNCINKCDYNGDGTQDHNVVIDDSVIPKILINIDYDYDGKCDLNCDTNGDLIPDYNIDLNGDSLPDVNIDYDGDKKPDYNIDTNNDGKPDNNISPDTNLYNTANEDITRVISTVTTDPKGKYAYVINTLEISAADIVPSWTGNYMIILKNETDQALRFKMLWSNVTNNYTEANNISYIIDRNMISYKKDLKVPYKDTVLFDNLTVKENTTLRFLLKFTFKETGVNQNIDSGKTYQGKFKIEVIK